MKIKRLWNLKIEKNTLVNGIIFEYLEMIFKALLREGDSK